MAKHILKPVPLTAEAFAPYGDVIELEAGLDANGWASDVMRVAVDADGHSKLSLFHCVHPVTLPFRVPKLEYHPLGSQAFIPRGHGRFITVVGEPGPLPALGDLLAFVSSGSQGINYRPGVWHTSLPSLDACSYLVFDRAGPGDNNPLVYLDEVELVVDGL